MQPFLDIRDLTFTYADRPALQGLTLTVPAGSFIALLGPNGSGKTTLFRLLAGLLRPASGAVTLLGFPLATQADAVRRQLGVVFQSASLDDKLTVRENLTHHGHLYGLSGQGLSSRIAELLHRFRLTDRAGDRTGTLSGGLQRRVELARCLLHRPAAILLDEPTNGLDPSARIEFWSLLDQVRREDRVSVLFTTHWFEEAEHADLVAILHEGRLVASGSPTELSASLGTEVITIAAPDLDKLAARLRGEFGIEAQLCHRRLRFTVQDRSELVTRVVGALQGEVAALTVAKPTLADVYVARTGAAWQEDAAP
jgi:ABC-2 type transport system ATP-binding protein